LVTPADFSLLGIGAELEKNKSRRRRSKGSGGGGSGGSRGSRDSVKDGSLVASERMATVIEVYQAECSLNVP
jgi:hypothetical protein